MGAPRTLRKVLAKHGAIRLGFGLRGDVVDVLISAGPVELGRVSLAGKVLGQLAAVFREADRRRQDAAGDAAVDQWADRADQVIDDLVAVEEHPLVAELPRGQARGLVGIAATLASLVAGSPRDPASRTGSHTGSPHDPARDPVRDPVSDAELQSAARRDLAAARAGAANLDQLLEKYGGGPGPRGKW